jgi:SAM-dependent methyltransferase
MPELTLEQANALACEKLVAPDLVQAVIKRNGSPSDVRVTLRPILIKAKKMVQISTFDGRKTDVKNYGPEGLFLAVQELVQAPYRSLFVNGASEDTQIQVTKKGKPLVTVKKRAKAVVPDLSHDRKIQRALPEGEPDPFLQKIGMMTADGRIKADRQRKFQQINEFIRLVAETADLKKVTTGPMLIVDFGCGNAYLTFALHYYLNAKLGVECELIGVDRNPESIARDEAKAADLESGTIHFATASIDGFVAPRPPDMVVALHACDTATDQALAQALRYESKLIFAAPCCQHHLQVQLGQHEPADPYLSIFRDGILKERLGDIVTDTLRAMILRIAGYKVDVIEFTSPEHTAKNLLIRAKKFPIEARAELISEYRALKQAFGVTPYLETIAPESLRAVLQ